MFAGRGRRSNGKCEDVERRTGTTHEETPGKPGRSSSDGHRSDRKESVDDQQHRDTEG
jgi:hypothetical protein